MAGLRKGEMVVLVGSAGRDTDVDADADVWAACARDLDETVVSRDRDPNGRAAMVVAFARAHAEALDDVASAIPSM